MFGCMDMDSQFQQLASLSGHGCILTTLCDVNNLNTLIPVKPATVCGFSRRDRLKHRSRVIM